MTQIKIVSNPYNREINYFVFNRVAGQWEAIKENNPNSRLREDETGKSFLPFKIKEIIDIIISEYYTDNNKIEIIFEGTQDEYGELEEVCLEEEIKEKIELTKTSRILENARFIFKDIREVFNDVYPIIEKTIRDDECVMRDLNKVSDALNDIIPICVFGNYSAGKSTFINALIGYEILPSGGDPVTAKIYKIERSTQPDRAKVKFTYQNEPVELSFEEKVYRVLSGNSRSELIQEINRAIEICKPNNMFAMVGAALEQINGFEKRDRNNTVLSNIIELEIPFSKKGVLGQSYNNFVIFDTPGSNSASNSEHSKVLAQALEGFTNGIPVWISQYETIDSEDNANLCDKIFEIQALDKRFTMIVLNKADGSDLGEDGFSREQVQEILEYNAVEKMYASGIYFVSSVMGLGAKNDGKLLDKHYRKIFRSQQAMYSEPEDLDYMTLYRYNIMPEQVKLKAMDYSSQCPNLIYANSGLYCVETEMENFASKHSAYNKCQMVYMFLDAVIEKTNRRIEDRTKTLKGTREVRRRELESEKQRLIEELEDVMEKQECKFDKESKSNIKSFVKDNMNYTYDTDELNTQEKNIRLQTAEKTQFFAQEKSYEKAKDSMENHLKSHMQHLIKGNIIDSLSTMKDDFLKDLKEVYERREDKDKTEQETDRKTSDALIKLVIDKYKNNITAAKDKLSTFLKEYWCNKTQIMRKELIELITGADALSVTQRETILDIIINYQPLEFSDDADNLFIKKRFLRGNVLGIMFTDCEKLNIRRLAGYYNDKMRENINEISNVMNNSCFASFKSWRQSLFAVVEENITEYNPQLRDMAEMIKEESERIIELEDNQQMISSSFKTIQNLMSWKVQE